MVYYDYLWSVLRIYGHEPYVPFNRKDGLPFRDLAGAVLDEFVKRLGQRMERIKQMTSVLSIEPVGRSVRSVDGFFKELK